MPKRNNVIVQHCFPQPPCPTVVLPHPQPFVPRLLICFCQHVFVLHGVFPPILTANFEFNSYLPGSCFTGVWWPSPIISSKGRVSSLFYLLSLFSSPLWYNVFLQVPTQHHPIMLPPIYCPAPFPPLLCSLGYFPPSSIFASFFI